MGSTEHIKHQLFTDGYTQIHEYDDPAGEYFPDHDHEGDQLVIILEGSISVKMGGVVNHVTVNNPLKIPAKEVHDVRIGEKGCKYIVGEKEA